MTEYSWPWPAGAATGVGSLPGTDIAEAQRVVLGELPDLPHLPELPARGPGADLIGRGAGLLVELPVELYAGRWRVAARPGRDLRRCRDLLERDLDQLTEQASDFTGSFKIAAAGPLTLAAGLDLRVGGRLLRDPGAVRDLTASLAEGVAAYVSEVATRLPGATVLLQLDEPSLPAVLAGQIPTESGFSRLPALESAVAVERLRTVIDAAGAPVVAHCCAPDAPLGLLRSAGAVALALDISLVSDLDALGEAIDAGVGLFAGVLDHTGALTPMPAAAPAAGAGTPGSARARSGGSATAQATSPAETARPTTSAAVAGRIRQLWHRLGFPPAGLPAQVVVTPSCGLAGASAGAARAALRTCREAGRRLAEDG